ncbi:serine/threonine protein kinase [Histoplasma capsulatum H143]|uniref:Serine/threonine protein kinase n=1 Tax=Ajellomyces capsulatus (strain H143) TaxID=544712 RepID=C6HP62_AJECH|nr:serine/threonine protein kinase [Histoplasma capsulatum H143]
MTTHSSLGKLGPSIAGSSSSSASPLLKLGQILIGAISTYTITRQLGDSVWLGRCKIGQTVVIKSAHNDLRITNERDVLKKFQSRTQYLRPLIDEIVEPTDPPAIVLRHLEDDLLASSDKLDSTDVKIDNVLVNFAPSSQGESEQRFTDIQLADLESTVHITSRYCQECDGIGTPIWRSPEAQLGLQWGPPTDIWSFGTMVISMIWGDNFFIFKPKVPRGHDEYELNILTQYHVFFGPYPYSYSDLADRETLAILRYIMASVPPDQLKPFQYASRKEISPEDKEFILKIMKMDPRDRPTAKELLEDEWFNGVE